MNENSPYDELVLKYLDKEMSETERVAFEISLKSNADLNERFEQLKTAAAAVQYYGIIKQVTEVRQQMEALPAKENVVPLRAGRSRKKILRFSLAVAACILFLCIGFIGYRIYTLNGTDVYKENYVAYNLPNNRSSETISPLEKAYSERNYSLVAELGKGAKTGKEKLLTGLSYLELDQPEAAINSFNSLLAGNDFTYKQDAEFYLSLALIKSGDYAKALPIMTRIHATPNHLYHNQVTKSSIRKVKILKWKSQ
jgi:tetratricopeptide (TPR) repeat protein